ncbi:MAG: spore germination protein [Eubacteriales bacterium]|nr:spore germination protein [Eubacteriales bacterium]MDN5363241.1 spore germination protein [Eubacteriales bacterium]
MLEKGRLYWWQLQWLLFNTVFPTAVMFVSAITAQVARQDAWIAILLFATVFGLVAGLVCYYLGIRFPRLNLVQYVDLLVGKAAGKVISCAYIIFFLWINAAIIREFSSFLATAFMPETPELVFTATIMLLSAYMVRNGLEVMASVNQLLVSVMLFVFASITLLSVNDMDFGRLLPVLEKGWLPVLKASLTPGYWRTEVAVMLMLLPYLKEPREGKRAVVRAVLILGFLVTVDVISNLAIFGPELTANSTFPTLNQIRYISLARFLDRIEAVVMILWVAGILIKVGVFYYVAVLALAQLFQLEDYKPVVLPVGFLLALLSDVLFTGSQDLKEFIIKPLAVMAYTFHLAIPLFLLLVAAVRRVGQ